MGLEQCAYHAGRPALAVCPACERGVCAECWHPAIEGCQQCALGGVLGHGASVPWEDTSLSLVRRVTGTFGQALSPTRSALSLRGPSVRPALFFAACTWLPLAMLQGIIPYTHTLLFQPGFVVEVQGHVSRGALAIDALRAAGLGLLLGLVQLVGLGAAFASLTTAFGKPGIASPQTAWRAVFYRAVLVLLLPAAMVRDGVFLPVDLGVTLLAWGGLSDPSGLVQMVLGVGCGVFLLTTLRVTARLAQGTSALMSFFIPFLALAVSVLGRLLADYALSPWMPSLG